MPYFLGMSTFLISQIILRLPLLSWFNQTDIGLNMQVFYPVFYVSIVGISAALFEEYGRYIIMKFPLKNRQSWHIAVWFGLGHGLIEVVLFFGLPLLAAAESLASASLWLGSVERILAVLLHVTLSILVMYSITSRKARYFIIALVAHALVDMSVGLFPMMFSNALVWIEGFLFIVSVLLLLLSLNIKKRWKVDTT